MRRHDTERRRSTHVADRYQRFQRAQAHEARGDFYLALRAYEGAGALRGAARMRARVHGAAADIPQAA
jgi:hypothetical protein